MSETSTAADRQAPGSRPGPRLFLRQVVAELRKVVWPTRSELLSYTGVVLVFVLAMMLLVSGLDYGIGKLVLLVFGSGS
ncbi:preprotein translocase subunit SecE [Kineococcus glutinatus]|uniref:Protein translocase subunit SecE n=1 Tax=Kineococcus glutinatus TaxID=1070872 RepID=A0ABP9H5H3_9ACTN